MIEVMIDKTDRMAYLKNEAGEHFLLVVQAVPREVNEENLVKTGQFSMDPDDATAE